MTESNKELNAKPTIGIKGTKQAMLSQPEPNDRKDQNSSRISPINMIPRLIARILIVRFV
jgi:hypothetical protein